MKPSGRMKNFCQLCRKMCRDENGYICHLNSNSHKQRVQDFKNDPTQLIEKNSNELVFRFIQVLKTKYPGEAKHLEVVYQEYEQQGRKFVKFSQTKWKGLKEFGEFLGSGQVKNIKITGTSPDCYITYTVNKTMQFIQKNKKDQLQALKEKQKQLFQKSLQNRIQRQKAQQQRQAKLFQQQMKKVQQQRQHLLIPDKLQFTFDNWGQGGKRSAFVTNEQLEKQQQKQKEQLKLQSNVHRKLENTQHLLEKLNEQQQRKNKKVHYSEDRVNDGKQGEGNGNAAQQDEVEWLMPGIVVKIKPHDIDSVFHNKKTKVLEISEPYVARVQVGTATLEIDQAYLQTVIPKIGNTVMVLVGDNKGAIGQLMSVDLMAGYGVVQLNDNVQVKLPFNYFSKYQQEE